MAMAVALTHGCRGCILFQADQALALGATAEEVLEACAVAISIGGTMGSAETVRVVAFLQERGLIDQFDIRLPSPAPESAEAGWAFSDCGAPAARASLPAAGIATAR